MLITSQVVNSVYSTVVFQSAASNISKNVHQGTVLLPTLFTIYINVVGQNVTHASFHLYADDMIEYSQPNAIT